MDSVLLRGMELGRHIQGISPVVRDLVSADV